MIRYVTGNGTMPDLHTEPGPPLAALPMPQDGGQGKADPGEILIHAHYTDKEVTHRRKTQDKTAHYGPVSSPYGPAGANSGPDKEQHGQCKEHEMKHTEAPEGADKERHTGIRMYAYIPAGEQIIPRLYLGRTKNICKPEGIYDNTDGSLIYIGTNPHLAGLVCGIGYLESQEELVRCGLFTEEDCKEYDNLRYTKLNGLARWVETRFEIGERPEGEPLQVPARKEGTREEIMNEIKARGLAGYMDYTFLSNRCSDAVLALGIGPGYIIMGNMAHNIAHLCGVPDDVIIYDGEEKRKVGLCALLSEELYGKLPIICNHYPVCISPDGSYFHTYKKGYRKHKAYKAVNETTEEFFCRHR